MIANLRELGKTVFLTTHYMEEAQALADRVAVIAAGHGSSPRERPRRSAAATRAPSDISFTPPEGVEPSSVCPPSSPPVPRLHDGRIHLRSRHPARTLHALAGWALAHGLDLDDLTVGRPTLEDVYLRLTETRSAAVIDRQLLVTQFRADLKIFWRSPQSRYFTLLLPIVFLVIFAAIFNGHHSCRREASRLTTYYVPGIMTLGIISASFVNLTPGDRRPA